MIDCVQKNLRALKVLKNEQNKLSDVLLINILVEKLDRESRRNFELSHKSKTVPTFQEFIEFLEQRDSVLLSVPVDRNAKVNPNKMYANNSKPKAFIVKENKKQKLYSVVYQAIVLSRIDYGCVAYGSAYNSTLQKLDPVHHMALRICSGAFRTSPVQSLYVNCHQLPLDLRRRKLSLAFYFKILSVPSHPLQIVYMSTSMKRLYDARPSNIRPFMDRMKLHISELDLPNVRIQQRNLFLFQPWNTPRFHYINPFATYSKSTVAPVVFQRVFAYHRKVWRSLAKIGSCANNPKTHPFTHSPTTAVSTVVIRPSTQMVRNVQITLAVEL
ncbi:RNase H domain-containing protein [Trichonephila clavipes]|nr:RNase H domain-containing protein [Trichonephila clavipes]